jgi:hypothetical protein
VGDRPRSSATPTQSSTLHGQRHNWRCRRPDGPLDFIGIEREPKYFDIACKRIEDAQRQGDFFVEAA